MGSKGGRPRYSKRKFKPRRRLHLAWILEELWAWGILSALVLQMIAEACLLDGLDNDKIQQFAQIAKKGEIPGNARRDLLRKSTVSQEKFPSTLLDLPVQAKVDKRINKTSVEAKTTFIKKKTHGVSAALDVSLASGQCGRLCEFHSEFQTQMVLEALSP